MILYLDASALVKRYVDEEGSDVVLEAMNRKDTWSMCRIGFVETVRAVARAGGLDDAERVRRDWAVGCDVIELDHCLAEHAARVAPASGLRAMDAIHLASALRLSVEGVVFATWDTRLHRAARAHRLRTLPAALG